ncbi:hypothetical protein K443DRAFT_676816 [Laccaria amethystina LaAM-08-1]|uniref:Unplaced genomic scaffold K443scaffold_46, whole genome shotgun sequence n=1 Tax=Laccaria amethystina LaAM-08-1 TaxID=1095629 RepID=A0A0C9XP86_9AGAR|nr:hypothetical protein K443DRAFT_676816 [Laccaria amethystina LaAM-08-1]
MFARPTSSFKRRPPGSIHSIVARKLNTLRRSYLYVPSSSERMLEKSLTTDSDVIIYDLEDSVPPDPSDKTRARLRLKEFLSREWHPAPNHVAVRVNDVTTSFFHADILEIVSNPSVTTLVLPKIHSEEDLNYASDAVQSALLGFHRDKPLNIVPSIESARAMWNLGDIAKWKSKHGPQCGGEISALLFAAEDFCADTSIIRTHSRRELLNARSQIVIAAKAFGLDAIDMVCVNYKDLETLKDECRDGRHLGFTGKQAIHPSQVETIQATFLPTHQEILRAAKILRSMALAHASEKGAFGLEGEMIDAPMLKQAQKIILLAEAAGLEVPSLLEPGLNPPPSGSGYL